MDFLKLANMRFSVRSYRPAPVEDDKLEMILEAGRLAPTAANRQAWGVVVVKEAARRRALGEVYPREWFWSAPVILAVCVEPGRSWVRADGKNYADVDGAIVMDHLTLCAAALDLGTCWIGAFDAAKARRILGLPDGVDPLALTPLGYPAEPIRGKSRKALGDLVHTEIW